MALTAALQDCPAVLASPQAACSLDIDTSLLVLFGS